jgi:hypothetical protein
MRKGFNFLLIFSLPLVTALSSWVGKFAGRVLKEIAAIGNVGSLFSESRMSPLATQSKTLKLLCRRRLRSSLCPLV